MATFRNWRVAIGLPVLSWLLADALIGLTTGLEYGLREGIAFATYPSQLTNYLGLLLVSGCGLLVRRSAKAPRLKIPSIVIAALLGPTLFFLISNLGVWYFDVAIGYPRHWAGLLEAYGQGIPFYKNQLISTAAFSALLFSPVGMSQLAIATSEPRARRLDGVLVRDSAGLE
jgi:hypothetical protein